MVRKLLLLIIGCLATVFCSPIFLSAADKVAVSGLNPDNIVETVPLPEPEPTPEEMPAAPVAGTNTVPFVSTVYTQPYVPRTPVHLNYTVTYWVSSVEEYNYLADGRLSYSDIYTFRKHVYAHNSNALMGNLAIVESGDTITVNDGGILTTYTVVKKVPMTKIDDTTLMVDANGVAISMKDVTFAKDENGNRYNMAFVTCRGYGDTPYRYVVYAN